MKIWCIIEGLLYIYKVHGDWDPRCKIRLSLWRLNSSSRLEMSHSIGWVQWMMCPSLTSPRKAKFVPWGTQIRSVPSLLRAKKKWLIFLICPRDLVIWIAPCLLISLCIFFLKNHFFPNSIFFPIQLNIRN